MKILIVEDDVDLRESLEGVLEFGEYACACSMANDGRDAIQQLQNSPDNELPDLILLDITMPVMNGFEFREAQLADDRLKDIPVVVTSCGHWQQELIDRLKPNHFIPKPILLSKLDKIVEDLAEQNNKRSTKITRIERARHRRVLLLK